LLFALVVFRMNHQIIHSDCRDYLNVNPFCPQWFDLMIADPPFNIGQRYEGYNDSLVHAEYRVFTYTWVNAYWQRLKPGAAMVLHGSVEASREILKALWELKIDRFIETELVWAYNFGQCNFNNFIQTHCRAVVVRKEGEPKKWYVENVLTESKRLLMGDPRVATSRYKGYVPFGTVWGVDSIDGMVVEPTTGELNWGRVQGNNRERRKGHPNQLPERYIERIIKAYSEERDLIFDGFGGSGTTITVAKYLNRSCVTTDVSQWNCESIQSRLNEGVKL